MSRLSIELTEREHQAIKALAIINDMNLREFVLGKVFDKISENPKNRKLKKTVLQAISELDSGKGKKQKFSNFIADLEKW
jgi:hypothetical protein